MQLPINANTFGTAFLGGKGRLDVETENDAWAALFKEGEPFDPTAPTIAKVKVGVGDEAANVKLGRSGGMQLSLAGKGSVAGTIHLVRSKDDAVLATDDVRALLAPGHFFAVLELIGTAEASAKASYVPGPLTATFGIAAGGEVVYRRYVLHPNDTSAREVLRILFKGVRLPHAIDTEDELPEAGEVLSLRHGGYLNLSAGVRWGYSLSGLRAFELGKLNLELAYQATVGAHLDLGYKVAGDFAIEAMRGHDDGWVRLTVRKSRNSQFDFAADVVLDADLELKGLPAEPDAFLGALLGTDVQSFLGVLQTATELSDVDKLRSKLDALAWDFVQERAHAWMDKALDHETAEEFFAIVDKVVTTYRGIEERAAALIEARIDKIPALRTGLKAIADLTGPEDLATLDNPAWAIVEALVGDRIHDLLVERKAFEAFRKEAARLLEFLEGAAAERVVDLIKTVKARYGLDGIVEKLETVKSAADLKALVDARLKGVVERLVGMAFDKIVSGGTKEALAQVHGFLSQLEEFKQTWYERLQKNTHQSFSASVAYAFTRASGEERLLDLEINLGREEGGELVRRAAGGDFAKALAVFDPDLVRVRAGVLTHHIEKSASLRVNVYGWESSSLTRIVQNLEHSIESDPAGLLHVYALDTLIEEKKQRGKRFKESVDSTFLLAAVGETVQRINSPAPVDPRTGAFIVENLRQLGVAYDLVQRDEETDLAELTDYLAFGEALGLYPSASALAGQLARDFPDGLGVVTASYAVRYDEVGVLAAFTLGHGEDQAENELAEVARKACRGLCAAQYIGKGPLDGLAPVGFAYRDPALARVFYKEGLTTLLKAAKTVALPAWFLGGTPRTETLSDHQREALGRIFRTEARLVDRLLELDDVVDSCLARHEPVPVPALQKAARQFVEVGDSLGDLGVQNLFFGVFDALVVAGTSGKGRRESALVLEITPPGGEKVRRIIMR